LEMVSSNNSTCVIQEFLLMDKGVSGLCLYPDLHDAASEQKNLMWLYKMWATIPDQTHSCNVAIADGNSRYYPETDALITFERDVPIGVKTADCVPILIYAPDKQCVGAIHAGWKGTLGGIVDNVMDMLEEKGVDPSLLKVAFGPSISKEIYEVSKDLAENFVDAGFGAYVHYPKETIDKPHIDLQGINMERFLRRGVRSEHIKLHTGCTFCSKMEDGTSLYASHRRSGGAPARMLTAIMLLSD
ncbi:MAG: polyphenol oxidase family protein, partial [Muribaculaceae bacterium]|nr:polyphenol oxidase family protein [Muribaculaceae bacterium]